MSCCHFDYNRLSAPRGVCLLFVALFCFPPSPPPPTPLFKEPLESAEKTQREESAPCDERRAEVELEAKAEVEVHMR